MLGRAFLSVALSLCLSLPAVADIAESRAGMPRDPEARLVSALDLFSLGEVDSAIRELEPIVQGMPNYRLAHLVYGDLMAARAGVPLSVESSSSLPRTVVNDLLSEARQRWRQSRFDPAGRVPEQLLRFATNQAHAVFVDLARNRLFVFRNNSGEPELVADYYVSGGKNGTRKRRRGDRRTPLGVYYITERLPGEALPDKYGPVAFPVDYPNPWDQRNGRTGSGIWLHGVSSETYSRPPLDSDGCVALTNEQLLEVAPMLSIRHTPVVIGENLAWTHRNALTARKASIEAAVEAWRRDWASGDVEAYLAHYADDFSARGMSKKQWSDYKRRVDAGKTFIGVELEDLGVLGYPDEPEMVVVTFTQDYRSNNFNARASKRQFWRQDLTGRWRIVYEGNY